MSTDPQPTRLPFHVEFFEAAKIFSTDALAKVPELQAVAIVPIWSPNPQDVPSGMFRVRADGALFLPQLFQMLGQLATFSLELQKKMADQLGEVDQYASKLTAEIKRLHDEYEKAKPQAENTDG